VGTAVDGADAVRQVTGLDPDVVLMDLNMPTSDGVEATRRLTESGSRARVVVLTTYADDDWVFRALQAIAQRLYVFEATVKTGSRDRAALVAYAYRTGRATP